MTTRPLIKDPDDSDAEAALRGGFADPVGRGSTEAMCNMSPTRSAAIAGLDYAAHLVDRFGWSPPTPDGPRLDLGTTLNLAACKTAVEAAQPVYDVEALMGYLLSEHLKNAALADWQGITRWQGAQRRTAQGVAEALRSAATTA